MKRGLLSGGVILMLGIALQLTVGPVPWARMAFPVNLIILLLSLAFLGAAFSLRRRVPLFDWLTRLWYAFFLPLVGILVYSRWRYRWVLSFTTVLALVFILVNMLKPEIHNKTMMPALMSPWFVPHVIVYMMSYAILGAATVMALYLLFFKKKQISPGEMASVDDLVFVGLAFLTFGMLFGALWAKEAWGGFWTWDPKETWAAVTWLCYLLYIHLRRARPDSYRPSLWFLLFSFLCLQMCWWGINYLQAARATSIHVY